MINDTKSVVALTCSVAQRIRSSQLPLPNRVPRRPEDIQELQDPPGLSQGRHCGCQDAEETARGGHEIHAQAASRHEGTIA